MFESKRVKKKTLKTVKWEVSPGVQTPGGRVVMTCHIRDEALHEEVDRSKASQSGVYCNRGEFADHGLTLQAVNSKF